MSNLKEKALQDLQIQHVNPYRFLIATFFVVFSIRLMRIGRFICPEIVGTIKLFLDDTLQN